MTDLTNELELLNSEDLLTREKFPEYIRRITALLDVLNKDLDSGSLSSAKEDLAFEVLRHVFGLQRVSNDVIHCPPSKYPEIESAYFKGYNLAQTVLRKRGELEFLYGYLLTYWSGEEADAVLAEIQRLHSEKEGEE